MTPGQIRILRLAGFNKQMDLVESGCCPLCEKKIVVNDFKDSVGFKEFMQSGMCQKCQDSIIYLSAHKPR